MINIIIRTFSLDIKTINIILENNDYLNQLYDKINERLNLTPEKYYFVYNAKSIFYNKQTTKKLFDLFGNTDVVFLHMYPQLKYFKN